MCGKTMTANHEGVERRRGSLQRASGAPRLVDNFRVWHSVLPLVCHAAQLRRLDTGVPDAKSRILSGSFISFPRAISLQPGYWESRIAVDPQFCGFIKSSSLAKLVVCNYVRIFSSCAARFAAVCVNRSGRKFLRAIGNQTSQKPIRQTHIRRPFVISDITT